MKKITLICIVFVSLSFCACEFSISTKKEIKTNYISKPNGIKCQNIDIERQAEVVTDNNTFFYGEKVYLIFNDIKGLKKEGEKVFPGLSMFIVKNEKDTVFSKTDLLSNLNSGTELSPLQLKASFSSVLPYKNNEQYKIHINIWDKKGESTFTYELPFIVEESDVLDITSNEITYSSIYLWNESSKKVVLNNEVNRNEKLMLILEGLEGLEQKNGNIFPILSVDLKDAKGKSIIYSDNLFKEYENEGVNAENFKEQIYTAITLDKGRMRNPYKLKVAIKDKNSLKRIVVTSELNFK